MGRPTLPCSLCLKSLYKAYSGAEPCGHQHEEQRDPGQGIRVVAWDKHPRLTTCRESPEQSVCPLRGFPEEVASALEERTGPSRGWESTEQGTPSPICQLQEERYYLGIPQTADKNQDPSWSLEFASFTACELASLLTSFFSVVCLFVLPCGEKRPSEESAGERTTISLSLGLV